VSDAEHKPFIPGWLDDAGLTAAQFRVFCHLSRRGNCYESLGAMSRCCHMRRPTIQAALKDLLNLTAIIKEKRTGQTSIYTLAPSPKQALGRNTPTQPKTGTRTQPKRGTTHLAQKRHYKGYPSKGSPIKGIPKAFSIDPTK
jgi:hypothetical protein